MPTPNELAQQLLEAFLDLDDRYVDPFEPFYDSEGSWRKPGESGGHSFAGLNESMLKQIRDESRALCLSNEFAAGAIENRINYVVGQGHRYHLVAKDGGDESLVHDVQEMLDELMTHHSWTTRQQEIMRRLDRDGEVFIRHFPSRKHLLDIRFVEPDQVTTPDKLSENPATSFGIQTEPHDVETVLGYWIDGQFVEADEIQHRKANVDVNVKRGLPLFHPVRKNLRRVEKLLRNMSVVAEIQSAIALIRKHSTSSTDAIRRFVQNQAGTASDSSNTDTNINATQRFQHFAPGTIIDAGSGTDYQFPIAAIDASRYILVVQAELRAIASRLVMPEFMLSSDASNANYASTMVAEGPAVRMFERLQHEMIASDLQLFRRAIRVGIQYGFFPEDLHRRISIHAIPPILAVRDRFKEAKADETLFNLGVISKQTLAMRYGLDPQRESCLKCQCEE